MTTTVHILQEGLARCGLIGPPSAWPDGHRWIAFNDEDKLKEANCPACLNGGAPPTYSAEEREVMLARMDKTISAFYGLARSIGCHPFIEFAGLMGEYLKICQFEHANGRDFTESSIHSGKPLQIQPFQAAYVGEKLGCIYGPSLQEPENLIAFLRAADLFPALEALAKAAKLPKEDL